MPHYYFHYRDKQGLTRDLDGQDFKDVETARHEAVLAARDALVDAVSGLDTDPLDAVYEVTDENDWVVAIVPFRTAQGDHET